MILSFEEFCAARYAAQSGGTAYTNENIAAVLRTCWWVTAEESITARVQTVKHPLQSTDVLETRIHGRKRYITADIFLMLYPQFREKFSMQHESVEFMHDNDCISSTEAKKTLGTKLLQRYLDKWQLIVSAKQHCLTENLYQQLGINYTYEAIIIHALQAYPYLSFAEIEYLTGIPLAKLGRPVHELTTAGKIIRNLHLQHDTTERFCSNDEVERFDVQEDVLLGIGDPLVDLLLHAKFVKAKGVSHLFFMKGVPQASMKIQRKNIQNFTMLSYATYSQEAVIRALQKWNEQYSKIAMNFQSAVHVASARKFTRLLSGRGYRMSSEGASLIRDTKKVGKGTTRQVTLASAVAWLLSHQLDSGTDVLSKNIQLESEDSLICRSQNGSLEGALYGSGINKRVGYILPESFQMCKVLYSNNRRLTLQEQKVLRQIEEHVHNTFPERILLALESMYLIARARHTAAWELAPEAPAIDAATVRRKLILQLLNHQLPLTKLQLLSYFGWQLTDLEKTLSSLLSSAAISEGYFIEHEKELQYTTEQTLHALHQQNEPNRKTYIIPSTDPIGRLYLSKFFAANPSLQPNKLYSPTVAIFLIYYATELIGYFVKTPQEDDVDYTLEIFVQQDRTKALAETIEYIANLFLVYYHQKGQITYINGISASQYENLRFTIELVGLKL